MWAAGFLMLPVCAAAQSSNDPGKISGYAFGDAYFVSQHHSSAIESASDVWFRRMYLWYDKGLGEGFSMRFRMEMDGPGDFSGNSDMSPFVKDLYLRYQKGMNDVYLGLIPTPTYSDQEDRLGYRWIEKTPDDLYKLGTSRDHGVSVKGPLSRDGKTTYWLMVGDGNGTSAKPNRGSTIYGQIAQQLTPEVSLEGYADHWNKTGHEDYNTLQGNLMYVSARTHAALLFTHQNRENGANPSSIRQVISLYADTKISANARPFARVDFLSSPIPGADTISYLSLSPNATPTFYIAGVAFDVSKDVKFAPNLEYVTYKNPTVSPGPKSDLFLRLTFQFSW